MEWVCAGLVVAAFVGWVILRGSVYRRLFADAHFVEVAQGVSRVRNAALGRVIASNEDEVGSPADPRALVTGAGLALLYTIRQADGQFVHHYSVSVAGGHTAHAVGETFVLFVAELLGVPFGSLALGVGRSTVHHAEFVLSSDEQAAFAVRAVAEVSPESIGVIRREQIEAGKQLWWRRLD